MSNYNEVLDSEKRALAKMVEASFYPGQQNERLADDDPSVVLQKLQQNPELVQQLLQGLLNGAVHAHTQKRLTSKFPAFSRKFSGPDAGLAMYSIHLRGVRAFFVQERKKRSTISG